MKLTVGAERPEQVVTALSVTAAGIAAGVEVSLWLTGEASWLGVAGRAAEFHDDLADPQSLLAAVREDGDVVVCSMCAARRGITAEDLAAGVRIAGASSFVEAIMRDGTQALVY